MANQLNIETGLQEFSLNGKVSVWFNPTDGSFIGRIYEVFDKFEKMEAEYKEKTKSADPAEIIEYSRQLDANMRADMVGVFGMDIVTPLIGEVNVYALADGVPIWVNILLAIIDVCDSTVTEEQKKSNARIKKYTDKYAKKYHN